MKNDSYLLDEIKANYKILATTPPSKKKMADFNFAKWKNGDDSYWGFLDNLVNFQMAIKKENYDFASDCLENFMYNEIQRRDYRCHMMWVKVLQEELL